MREVILGLSILPLAAAAATSSPSTAPDAALLLAVQREVAAYIVERDSIAKIDAVAAEALAIRQALAASVAPERDLRDYGAAYRREMRHLGIARQDSGRRAGQHTGQLFGLVCQARDGRLPAAYLTRLCEEWREPGMAIPAVPSAATSAAPSAAALASGKAMRFPTAAALAGVSPRDAGLASPPPALERQAPAPGAATWDDQWTLLQARLISLLLGLCLIVSVVMHGRQRRRLRTLENRLGHLERIGRRPPDTRTVLPDGTDSAGLAGETADPQRLAEPYGALTAHGSWKIFHTTQQGRGHSSAKPPQPCQDRHRVHPMADEWGVAIVCDGAGSHVHSAVGAEFVAHHLVALVSEKLPGTAMFRNRAAPTEADWRAFAKALMLDTYLKLEAHVQSLAGSHQDISMANVGCTVILVIYAPFGLLMAHIGDGQAGYRDASGWHPMMTPFKGEYANQTVFLSSRRIYANALENPDDPHKPFLETRVIDAPVLAFTLMSDGMESGLCETVIYDPATRQNRAVNRPHAGAFEQVRQRLCGVAREAGAAEKMQREFLAIVEKGNKKLVDEQDDKTLVLGLCGC